MLKPARLVEFLASNLKKRPVQLTSDDFQKANSKISGKGGKGSDRHEGCGSNRCRVVLPVQR